MSLLVKIMACRLFGAKPLSDPMMTQLFTDMLTYVSPGLKIKTQSK